MPWIVRFPAAWFLLEYAPGRATATGDAERATRFATAEAAKTALTACRRSFKPAMVKVAAIEEIAA
jgi:hypothetical protein